MEKTPSLNVQLLGYDEIAQGIEIKVNGYNVKPTGAALSHYCSEYNFEQWKDEYRLHLIGEFHKAVNKYKKENKTRPKLDSKTRIKVCSDILLFAVKKEEIVSICLNNVYKSPFLKESLASQ